MLRVRKVGLCLAVVFGAAAVTAASASAEAPEFGRCVKQAGGKFKTGSCTTAAVPGEERFEWLPGGVNGKFTTADKAGSLITFESVGGTKITCTNESAPGEATGAKTLSLTLTFKGCETSKGQCTSPGQSAGTVVTSPLQGELGTIQKGAEPAKSKAGLELSPVGGGAFAECSVSTIHVPMRGSLIAGLAGNSMRTVYTIKYTESKGKQKPERFEGGPLAVLEWNTGLGYEQLGLKFTMILTAEEKIEVSTVN